MTDVYAHLWVLKDLEIEITNSRKGECTLSIGHGPTELGKHHMSLSFFMKEEQLQLLQNTIEGYLEKREKEDYQEVKE